MHGLGQVGGKSVAEASGFAGASEARLRLTSRRECPTGVMAGKGLPLAWGGRTPWIRSDSRSRSSARRAGRMSGGGWSASRADAGWRGSPITTCPRPALPMPGSYRIENDGFSEPMLAQYLEARMSGMAVMAQALSNSVRPVYLDDFDLHGGARDARAPASRRLPRRRGDERPRAAELRAEGAQRHLRHRPRARGAAADAGGDGGLRWACQAMHLRYCELLLRELGEVPVLSSREAEVLKWVAHGKTNGLDRRDPRHLGPHGRRPPPAGLSQARGRRPDFGGAPRPRVRADHPRTD